MAPALGLLALLLFAAGFWRFGGMRAAMNVLAVMRQIASVLRDPQLDDLVKEAAAQRGAFQLLIGFCSIAGRGALACLLSLVPVWIADATGLARREAVLDYLSRWDVLVVASVVLTAAYLVGARLWRLTQPTRP